KLSNGPIRFSFPSEGGALAALTSRNPEFKGASLSLSSCSQDISAYRSPRFWLRASSIPLHAWHPSTSSIPLPLPSLVPAPSPSVPYTAAHLTPINWSSTSYPQPPRDGNLWPPPSSMDTPLELAPHNSPLVGFYLIPIPPFSFTQPPPLQEGSHPGSPPMLSAPSSSLLPYP
ncbi:hypothetical protein AMTR_s00036p00205620, partial [Amborella trichopoda]